MRPLRLPFWLYFWNCTFFRFLRNTLTRRAARLDARSGQSGAEEVRNQYLGKQVTLDEAGNVLHRDLARQARAEQLPSLEAELVTCRRHLARRVSARALAIAFLLLVLLETLGNSIVTRDLGSEGVERWLFALLLSLAVFLLVYLASQQETSKKKVNAWYIATLIALALIVVAITLMRLSHGTDNLAYVLAEGAIFATCTMGAAIGSHKIFAAWHDVSPSWRETSVVRREVNRLRAERERALLRITTIERTRDWWENESVILLAIYHRAWRRAAVRQ
ncbi:MAG: hypothetical protein EDX89_08520 [Acidobacteria bacterium]|nr:MAG: hypothetical protein EDX89_08520 [Acidobacteriota bacterium]